MTCEFQCFVNQNLVCEGHSRALRCRPTKSPASRNDRPLPSFGGGPGRGLFSIAGLCAPAFVVQASALHDASKKKKRSVGKQPTIVKIFSDLPCLMTTGVANVTSTPSDAGARVVTVQRRRVWPGPRASAAAVPSNSLDREPLRPPESHSLPVVVLHLPQAAPSFRAGEGEWKSAGMGRGESAGSRRAVDS